MGRGQNDGAAAEIAASAGGATGGLERRRQGATDCSASARVYRRGVVKRRCGGGIAAPAAERQTDLEGDAKGAGPTVGRQRHDHALSVFQRPSYR